MAGHKPGTSNATWTIVLIIVGALIVAGLMNLGGLPLWAQFAVVGILIIIGAVVVYFWRSSTRGRGQ